MQLYKLYPSAADRWLNCPGSVPLSVDAPYKPSKFASEGTVAHAIAEDCLRLEVAPDYFKGTKRSADGFEFEVGDDMVAAVGIYLDLVRGYYPTHDVKIETRVDRPSFVPSDIATLSGRIDFLARRETPDGVELLIIDFKFGAGVAVDADANDQLLTYAAISAEKFAGDKLRSVEVVIVQPRAAFSDAVKSAVFTPEAIAEHARRVHDAAILANQAGAAAGSKAILDYMKPGDWCRWCPIKAKCPKLHAQALEDSRADFSIEPLLTPAAELPIDRLVWWLENAKTFSDWLGSLQELAEAMAREGKAIPGFKLVETRANRRWVGDEAEIVKALRKAGLTKGDLYVAELVSPAQAEKLPSKLPKAALKELVDKLTHRPVTGSRLVKDDDPRPANDPAKDFEPVKG